MTYRPHPKMNPFRVVLGALIIIAGFALGVWLGLVVCFIGGIAQIIDAVQADPVEGTTIAWGLAKIVCSVFVGIGAFFAMFVVGGAMVITSDIPIRQSLANRKRRNEERRTRNIRGVR